MASNAEHIKWFRDSSPYIDAHRGKTFVLCLTGDALQSANLHNIITDIALLNSLGVRLVVVFGADHQIGAALKARGLQWECRNGQRIVTPDHLSTVTGVLGEIAADLSARFSASSLSSPHRRVDITTSSGNFVKARPIGIIDGIDHQLSGEVRKINHAAIEHQLDGGMIVLIPAIGFSPSGESFYLNAGKVARDAASALTADKLIYFTADIGLYDIEGTLISEIDLSDFNEAQIKLTELTARLLAYCDTACHQQVARCHIISFTTDGAILEELFTRDGCGTQVIGRSYEQIRAATIDDVPGIIGLIAPLEATGVLVKRSRERLESEVNQFIVIERDGLLISCAALYPFDQSGELACLVTHPDYRDGDRGDRLLEAIEKTARTQKLKELFVLTTQSAHWFVERGFERSDLESLPPGEKAFYNDQRSALILKKVLGE